MVPKHVQQERTKRFINICRCENLRLTPQKIAIFDELVKTCDHPSAQMIYERLMKNFPNMSFATVYKNLRLFCDLDLIVEIETPDGTARYDANAGTHHHIVNTKTGEIIDAKVEGKIPLPTNVRAKIIRRVSVTYFI